MNNSTTPHTPVRHAGSSSKLELFTCNFQYAKHAVEKWHYSHVMPAGRSVKIGVLEDLRFIGAVIFSKGANNNIGKPYKLAQHEICELTRVALKEHKATVSRIVAIALKILRKKNPKIRMVVSYADIDHGHYGGIYQAGGWLYQGIFAETECININGKKIHRKTLHSRYGTSNIKYIRDHIHHLAHVEPTKGKHKYVYLFDKTIKIKTQPYPKCAGSIEHDASDPQSEQGGESPTPALQP